MLKIKNLFIFLIIITYPAQSVAKSVMEKNLSQYMTDLEKFKCNFIQYNPDGTISEGNMIYSKNRIRINYTKPSLNTFIAREKKAMYFNEDLMEVHYFNPNKTAFSIFKSIFNFNEMPEDSYKFSAKNNFMSLEILKTNIDEIKKFEVVFQDNPVELKKIKWLGDE